MQDKIADLLKDINGKDRISDFNMDLFENDMLDSLGIAQLVAALEENFNIEIDPEDILPENFSTINEISALVRKYMA
ncbi:acyl carrier protein [uncultured Dialister sp.]|mgnify:FL=1|uniref:acyl carrier protein n=1 Tax=uncultured Dialister sp. TaxID=278064 RepID=UPI0025DC0B7B|nr:phosphopantetheine-binding protein [uncultured Dialister sp.]